MNLEKLRLHVAAGPPCTHEHQRAHAAVRFSDSHRQPRGEPERPDDHRQRQPDRDVPDVDQQHLHADEGEDERQPLASGRRTCPSARRAGSTATRRPISANALAAKTMNGSCVTAKIAGIESTANTMSVDRDHDEHGQQRRDVARAQPVHQLRRVEALAVAGELPRRVDQQDAEDVERDVERVQQRRADQDEDQAQDSSASMMPHDSAFDCCSATAEAGEDHREDEDVVERQRALEQVAGEVLRAGVAALPDPERGAERAARCRSSRSTRACSRARWACARGRRRRRSKAVITTMTPPRIAHMPSETSRFSASGVKQQRT